MVRRLEKGDKELYLKMSHEFYNSDAVLHSVPDENFEKTFQELMKSDLYAEAFILSLDGEDVGYALLAKTFSQEAGGLCIWIEELYVRQKARGKGLGSEFFKFLLKNRPATRYRLEIEPENEGAIRLYKRYGFADFPYGQMAKDI